MTGHRAHLPVSSGRPFGRAPRPPDHALPIAFARGVPSDLSVAWLAIAPLYVLSPRGLPEPIVALLVSTTVGVFCALVKAGFVDRPATVPVTAPRRVAARPSAPADPPIPGAGGPTPVPTRRPAGPPTDRPLTPTAGSATDLDYDSYPADTDPAETQCPNCGRFAVIRRGGPVVTAHCTVCQSEWDLGAGIEPPDVVVRSWLSGPAKEPR